MLHTELWDAIFAGFWFWFYLMFLCDVLIIHFWDKNTTLCHYVLEVCKFFLIFSGAHSLETLDFKVGLHFTLYLKRDFGDKM